MSKVKPSQYIKHLLLTLIICTNVNAIVPPAEKAALIALYNSTNGANWTDSTNWNVNDPCDDNWFGVDCAGGLLTKLTLESNNLVGLIPATISDLASLQELRLRNNQLNGNIPTELGTMMSFTYLDLSNNLFIGDIPDSLGSLTNLTTLDLSSNKFVTGFIPVSFATLINLQRLRLGGSLFGSNQIEGTIPGGIWSIASLKDLKIAYTQITGSIPVAVSSLINLNKLDLSYNELTGSIPIGLGTLPLTYLSLGGNQSPIVGDSTGFNRLTGAIPADIWNLSSLQYLLISHTKLSGTISPLVANLNSLISLRIRESELSGTIPSAITTMSTLTHLEITESPISGSIPSEIGDLTNLTYLVLKRNQLTGGIPVSIGSLFSLNRLDFFHNQLSGAIPDIFVSLVNLTFLGLDENEFTGTIPASIGGMIGLQYLKLNWNQLSGSIPTFIGGLVNLKSLGLAANLFDGTAPTSLGNLTQLTSLFLYGNNLHGEIPASFSNLTNLSQINFGLNAFSANASSLDLDALCGCDWLETQTLHPINGQVPVASDVSLGLYWDPVSYNSSGGYKIFRSETEFGVYVEIGQTDSKGINAYIDDGHDLGAGMNLSNNTEYFYKIKTYSNAFFGNPNEVLSEISQSFSGTTLAFAPITDITIDIILTRIRPPGGNKNTPVGSTVEYQIIVKNTSGDPNYGVEFIYNFPEGFINTTWICTSSTGTGCPAVPQNENIDEMLDIEAGASFIFDFTTEVDTNADDDLSITSIALPPDATFDTNLSNNTDLINVARYYVFDNGFE